ncbi:MAG: SDR family NAD(P)-dependent oxidoreductase [Bdellovibrionota bacterium]
MNDQYVVIMGANSAIASAFARFQVASDKHFILVGRDQKRLEELAQELVDLGAENVEVIDYDFSNIENHASLTASVFSYHIKTLLIAYGTLPNQQKCLLDPVYGLKHYHLNATSTISLLCHVFDPLKKQRSGKVAVITSVAGDRGKKSNYLYGSAKGSVSIFLQGYRVDLAVEGVHVMDIKPGFVDTPMTKDMKKGLLWAQPDHIARSISRGLKKNKNVVYAPLFWKYIMCLFRMIPEELYKKLKL